MQLQNTFQRSIHMQLKDQFPCPDAEPCHTCRTACCRLSGVHVRSFQKMSLHISIAPQLRTRTCKLIAPVLCRQRDAALPVQEFHRVSFHVSARRDRIRQRGMEAEPMSSQQSLLLDQTKCSRGAAGSSGRARNPWSKVTQAAHHRNASTGTSRRASIARSCEPSL